MPSRLLVIMGAGASFDCTSAHVQRNPEYQPPLVTQLFEHRATFTEILHRYPLAEQAAADIRPALAEGTLEIERLLREELRDSGYAHKRRQYWAVPLYLQDLFFQIGRWDSGIGYAEHPDIYDRLLNATLAVDEVTYVTLNYDNLFDRRLFAYAPLESMVSYLGDGQNWALIKLHGSVDWGRRILHQQPAVDDLYLANTFAAFGEKIPFDSTIELRKKVDIQSMRAERDGYGRTTLFYPALSAPLGPQDDLVCPDPHLQYLRDRTGDPDPLDVLVIGYSGLDQSVLDAVAWGGRRMNSLTVVSGDPDSTREAASRIAPRLNIPQQDVRMSTKGFAAFVQEDLDSYVARLRKAAE